MKRAPSLLDEEMFAKAFVKPAKRLRVLGQLQKEKTRAKFLSLLPHFADFDPRFCRVLEPIHQRADSILRILRDNGALATCYVISVWPEVDQMRGALDEVLVEVVGYLPGTIVSCVPGQLAFYEGEARNDRRILERPRLS